MSGLWIRLASSIHPPVTRSGYDSQLQLVHTLGLKTCYYPLNKPSNNRYKYNAGSVPGLVSTDVLIYHDPPLKSRERRLVRLLFPRYADSRQQRAHRESNVSVVHR